MIKYLELTAPEKSEFRQVKIVSIEVAEGDQVEIGDTLFKVKSGKNKIDLPSTMTGKVVEIIALVDENISVMTPLVLLETEVQNSTATPPIITDDSSYESSLDKELALETKEPSTEKRSAVIDEPSVAKKEDSETKPDKTKKKRKNKKAQKKSHKQQSLNLDPQDSHTEETANDELDTEKPITEPKTTHVPPKTIETKTMSNIQVTVPDIGADNAKVIEIFVAVGDKIEIDDPLVTLESDKASMDVPSTHAGTITSISIAVDQEVNEGTLLVELSSDTAEDSDSTQQPPAQVMEEVAPTQSPQVVTTSQTVDVIIPDIGGDSAKVIEILVEVGQSISQEDPLITLESDKASMDVPSTVTGIVQSIEVNVDQDVSEGMIVVKVSSNSAQSPASESAETPNPAKTSNPAETSNQAEAPSLAETSSSSVVEVTIPDIGGDSAKVIEVLVSVGQEIEAEDPLVTLESDKASMDVPTTVSGTIESIDVQVDQDVSEGMLVVKVLSAQKNTSPAPKIESPEQSAPTEKTAAPVQATAPIDSLPPATGKSHASPSIRRFARELGVDLSKVGGSGRKGRIVKSDVKAFVKNVMLSGGAAQASNQSGSGIPSVPAIDFTKFGEIDRQPLNKIKKLTAKNLHRSWLNVPHVTHNDESNISDLESFRKQLNTEYAAQDKGIKLSPLAFIVKAAVHALRTYPQFNSSLEPGGESIIYKKYIHIGIAVETPNGLVVPVIRDADKMSISEIALAMGELAKKARDKKLSPADMSGASFTISSLGGIGGTSFTPIVNAPEVAILGVARSKMQPVWNGKEFEPGMILPLSLSYDHRIIDGAEAARFTAHIASALEDVRRLTV